MNSNLHGLFRFTKYSLLLLLVPFFAVLDSCKQDTGGIGANVLPKSDLISAYQSDTSLVVTSMYFKDSVATSAVQNCILGSYADPLFGTTKASIYAQVFSPVGATVAAASWTDSTVDSAVLVLPYFYNSSNASYYGNLDPQTIVVDTLVSNITTKNSAGNYVAYYNDTTIKYDAAHPIAIRQITPPAPASEDTIRIKLSNAWCQYIVNRIKGNTNYYPIIDSLIKGLYITTANPIQLPGQGGLLYLNLQNSFAGIYFYFHGKLVTTPEYQPVVFPVGGTSFTHVEHNYSTAVFNASMGVGKHDSMSANDLIYVQTLGGVVGRINFPNIHSWAKFKPVIINGAELDIPVNATDAQNPFAPPLQLYVYGTDADGYPYALPDLNFSYYGGTYDAFNSRYIFYITDYIQHVIDGKTIDRGLFIIPAYTASTANRVVLYGARNGVLPNTSPRTKLKIYYTPLKH